MSELKHYGTPRHSGRYPWGSGDNPYQSSMGLLAAIDDLKKQGLSEVDIAKGLGMNTAELRAYRTNAKAVVRAADASEALRLKEKGYSNTAIGAKMGINESSVRSLLDPSRTARSNQTREAADQLKKFVGNDGLVDVGVGTEMHLGMSRTKLKASLELLKAEGYTIHYVPVEQLGTGKKTSIMVLAPPDTTYSDVWKNRSDIKPVTSIAQPDGTSLLGIKPPTVVNSDRVSVVYSEDGGSTKDGVIELRRGVEDISLGDSKYAQVRISVDGTHYLKGMAMYADDLPNGVDLRFNTNKSKTTPKMDAMKKISDDPDNPFGATVTQREYLSSDGKKKLSALNIVNQEGDWNDWSRTLSSQMLSKQSPALAKKQLEQAFNIREQEFKDISALTNPAVKAMLLNKFADGCDSASVHLKAAALPRQRTHVILPFNDVPDNEVYAPNYRNGERVALVRFPHGGIFEIPVLTVNNKLKGPNTSIKGAKDAIGINAKVAERLSGADFDGDTVLVIPNNRGEIKTSAPLAGLKNFDPKASYPAYEGMPKMTAQMKGQQMGQVSNLITDMTIKGASQSEIAAAVRHSMVVIDAEKHNLNYKQSAIDNNIPALKAKYQGGERAGASTLISRSSAESRPLARKELPPDPKTGERRYQYTGETYTKTTVNRQGVETKSVIEKRTKSTRMAETKDARTLSSGTKMENVYADHANKLKDLANASRKDALSVKRTPYSPSAKETYRTEVDQLRSQLNVAMSNKPRERAAQTIANATVRAKRRDNPQMSKDDLKRLKRQALAEARARAGAGRETIDITPKQWDAIQAGAVSNNLLATILDNANLDQVKQYATPRTQRGLSDSQIARARSMASTGYTQAEIADSLGVSTSTITNVLS